MNSGGYDAAHGATWPWRKRHGELGIHGGQDGLEDGGCLQKTAVDPQQLKQ